MILALKIGAALWMRRLVVDEFCTQNVCPATV
jgi:hypothetical protein